MRDLLVFQDSGISCKRLPVADLEGRSYWRSRRSKPQSRTHGGFSEH